MRRRVFLAGTALLIAAPAAQGAEPSTTVSPAYTRGTNVYPAADTGPPGSAFEDLLRYQFTHPRDRKPSRPSTTDQTCPTGADSCASNDLDVSFSGDTGLAVPQIPDAFGIIARIGAQQLNCGGLTAVKAEVLAQKDVPPNDLASGTAAPADYERWTATLCGKDVAFLLGVWPTDGKHPPFRVVYPFAP